MHVDHLYRKLGVHDRLMAVRVAADCGLWLPVKGRQGGGNAAGAASSRAGDPHGHRVRDVAGDRALARIAGNGVARFSAPY